MAVDLEQQTHAAGGQVGELEGAACVAGDRAPAVHGHAGVGHLLSAVTDRAYDCPFEPRVCLRPVRLLVNDLSDAML